MTSCIRFLISMFGTRMCGQTLLFIVIVNCAIWVAFINIQICFVTAHLCHWFLVMTGADMSLLNKSMPVGPVAGGIMACLLLLALAVYCYRCHTRRRSHRCNGSLPGEGRLHDSNVDFEDLDDANNGTVTRICY